MALLEELNVVAHGPATRPAVVLVHGFGSDQSVWRHLVPELADEHRVVTYDQAGSGPAAPGAFDPHRHGSLDGYADDLLRVCAGLDLDRVVVVGHSVSAIIAVLAHIREPERVVGLVLMGCSPRYVDDPPYVGGFSQAEVDELLAGLAGNYEAWAERTGPAMMGTPERPDLGEELTGTMLGAGPERAEPFARATFLSDNREVLGAVQCPTLVLQTPDDPVVPPAVGEYVHDHIAGSALQVLQEAHGHFPQLTAPAETARRIRPFLRRIRRYVELTG